MKLDSIKFYKLVKQIDAAPWNCRAIIHIEEEPGNTQVSLFSWDSFTSAVAGQSILPSKIGYSYELLVQKSDGSEIIMRFEESNIDLPSALAMLGYIES